MTKYKNLNGNSGVKAYEINSESIVVQFNDLSVYEYSVESVGKYNFDKMKELAEKGRGLNSFINRQVKKLYSQKNR